MKCGLFEWTYESFCHSPSNFQWSCSLMWHDVPFSCIFDVKGLGSVKSPESPLYFYGEMIFFSPLARFKSSNGYWCGHCLKAFPLDRDVKYGLLFFLKEIWVYTDAFNLNSGYMFFTSLVLYLCLLSPMWKSQISVTPV